jgi:hypothetical protein
MDAGNINSDGTWIRSSRCGPQHNCVELSHRTAGVILRDSKGDKAAVLMFDHVQWLAFVRGWRPVF